MLHWTHHSEHPKDLRDQAYLWLQLYPIHIHLKVGDVGVPPGTGQAHPSTTLP